MTPSDGSLFSRWISQPRPMWVTITISILLLLTPLVAVALDGVWDEMVTRAYWRQLLLPPVIIVYIIVVGPTLHRYEQAVIRSFRSIVMIDDDSFNDLIKESNYVKPLAELAAIGIGAAFGLWMSTSWTQGSGTKFWMEIYIPLALGAMFGLLGWVIYGSIATTRITAELHSQPLKIDLFDTTPFNPIGRQSLALAMVFLGGILLSITFGLDLENISAWQSWFIYIPLAMVVILVFFLNMWPTHKVLAAEKKKELEALKSRLQVLNETIHKSIASQDSISQIAPEYNVLTAYESRLLAVRTWPYNTFMLRTLCFSILIPWIVEWVIVAFIQ